MKTLNPESLMAMSNYVGINKMEKVITNNPIILNVFSLFMPNERQKFGCRAREDICNEAAKVFNIH